MVGQTADENLAREERGHSHALISRIPKDVVLQNSLRRMWSAWLAKHYTIDSVHCGVHASKIGRAHLRCSFLWVKLACLTSLRKARSLDLDSFSRLIWRCRKAVAVSVRDIATS